MTEYVLGFFTPWIVFALVLGLQLVVPARELKGYARDEQTGEPLTYRLNGFQVFIVVVVIWLVGGITGLVPFDWFWQHRWEGVAGALVLALPVSLAVLPGVPAQSESRVRDFFLGRRRNPRLFAGRVDAKMYLYVMGATLLELNLLSFAAHHVLSHPGNVSPGVILYVGLFTWFVCDYLVFERVHLYTYDLFAERLGFKLIGGCMVFYPYFYVIGLWAVADLFSPDPSAGYLAFSAAVFFAGWVFSRGANLQKYCFKRNPSQVFLGWFKPRSISDGERELLCSGFWRVSRHVNYMGEVIMAVGLTLSLGWPLLVIPWLYPVYYVLLLGARERDDDRRCEEKYGELWGRYREKVPRRIIPYVY